MPVFRDVADLSLPVEGDEIVGLVFKVRVEVAEAAILEGLWFGHSMTRLARWATCGGISMPSWRASFALMTNSRRDITSTERSPGFDPLRNLSAMTGRRGHVSATLVP